MGTIRIKDLDLQTPALDADSVPVDSAANGYRRVLVDDLRNATRIAGVAVDELSPPSAGQVLTAVGTTDAEWATPAATDILSNLAATAAPTVNDDSGDGYEAGSLWVVSSGAASGLGVWIAVSVGVGAAVWQRIAGKHNIATTASAPAVTDDEGDGYSIGSWWVTTGGAFYVCVVTTVGAAVWAPVITDVTTALVAAANAVMDADFAGAATGVMTRTGAAAYAVAKYEPAAGGAPGTGDDSGDGYGFGSVYYDSFNNALYVCVSADLGLAEWRKVWPQPPLSLTSSTATTVAAASAVGVATDAARGDHVHAHGGQTDGTMHAAVVAAGASGFMTGADKTKLDGIEAGADATVAASDTVAGKVELATSAEVITGTDTARAVTPAGVAAASVPLARTVSAGTGLTGGGDLSANRTLTLDITGLTTAVPDLNDEVAAYVDSALKKIDLLAIHKARIGVDGCAVFDDFMSGLTGSHFSAGVSGTGASATQTNVGVPASHPGVVTFSTGTTTTGRAGITETGYGWRFGDGPMRIEWLAQIVTLPAPGEQFEATFGWDNLSGSTPTITVGAWFAVEQSTVATTWRCRSNRAGAEKDVDSGVTVTAGAWVRLAIEVNADRSEVTFYIDGTLVGTINTGAWPSNGDSPQRAAGIYKIDGTTARTMYLDSAFGWKTLTTPRT